jgi:hypothetical protein
MQKKLPHRYRLYVRQLWWQPGQLHCITRLMLRQQRRNVHARVRVSLQSIKRGRGPDRGLSVQQQPTFEKKN